MKIKCPVCDKEKDIDFGKYICSDCKSKFEYQTDGKIVLIKRNKFDFWNFLIALTFPVLFLILFSNKESRDNIYNNTYLLTGVFMVFYPFFIAIRHFYYLGFDSVTLLSLYLRFFNNELKKEDIGRQIGFYLTLTTNIAGVILLITKLIK
jgi:uncharacterized protein YlaI